MSTTTTTLLDALATRSLTKEALHSVALDLSATAAERFGASCTDEQRRTWCCEQLSSILAHFDNSRDVLGVIADLPLSDRVERWAIRKVVEHALLKLHEPALAPVPPSLEPTPSAAAAEEEQACCV